MINYIWFVMIFLGLIVGIFTGNGEGISNAIIGSIDSTVSFIIGLVGLMCFWCGVMKVAEKSGFTEKLAKLMKPILKLIFKESAKDEKALGAIVMNITANMMGLGNEATPFGIKAMEEMEKEVNEEVEEEKPKTKKRTRKKAKKESSDTTIVIDSEPLSVEEYKDYMAEIIRPSIQEWEDEKEEVKDKMSTLNLDPNMNPKEIRELLAGLTDMHKEMQDRLDEAKVNLDNTVELIKSVEIKAAAEGANAEERKLKALIAKENYVKEGETHSVNLTVFKQLLNERVLFYNSQINTLEYNKFLVMTFQKVCSTENKGF